MTAVLRIIRRQRKNKRRKPTRAPRWMTVLGIVAAGAVVVGVGLLVREILLLPSLRVHEIRIRGMERLTDADFRPLMTRNVGQPMLLLDLASVRRQLEESPGVRTARVARRLPDALEATIVERRAIARAFVGGREVLVDEDGMIFQSLRALPGDGELPELRGLATTGGDTRLLPIDRPAIEALVAFARITGEPLPENTTVDLTPKDKVVMRPGRDAAVLWLNRNQPELNLRNLFKSKNRVADISTGGPVDLRFPHRLTLVPAPPEADGTQTE